MLLQHFHAGWQIFAHSKQLHVMDLPQHFGQCFPKFWVIFDDGNPEGVWR